MNSEHTAPDLTAPEEDDEDDVTRIYRPSGASIWQVRLRDGTTDLLSDFVIEARLRAGTLSGTAHVAEIGSSGWRLLSEIPAFARALFGSSPAPAKVEARVGEAAAPKTAAPSRPISIPLPTDSTEAPRPPSERPGVLARPSAPERTATASSPVATRAPISPRPVAHSPSRPSAGPAFAAPRAMTPAQGTSAPGAVTPVPRQTPPSVAPPPPPAPAMFSMTSGIPTTARVAERSPASVTQNDSLVNPFALAPGQARPQAQMFTAPMPPLLSDELARDELDRPVTKRPTRARVLGYGVLVLGLAALGVIGVQSLTGAEKTAQPMAASPTPAPVVTTVVAQTEVKKADVMKEGDQELMAPDLAKPAVQAAEPVVAREEMSEKPVREQAPSRAVAEPRPLAKREAAFDSEPTVAPTVAPIVQRERSVRTNVVALQPQAPVAAPRAVEQPESTPARELRGFGTAAEPTPTPEPAREVVAVAKPEPPPAPPVESAPAAIDVAANTAPAAGVPEVEEEPSSAAAPAVVEGPPFDLGAARNVLDEAASTAVGCGKEETDGEARVRVLFSEHGAVLRVNLMTEQFAGDVGDCVLKSFQNLRVPSYGGKLRAVYKNIAFR